jgi:hypothetical protein
VDAALNLTPRVAEFATLTGKVKSRQGVEGNRACRAPSSKPGLMEAGSNHAPQDIIPEPSPERPMGQ